MAIPASSFGSRLYTAIAIVLLTLWTTTALGFAALDVINENRGLIQPIASISLLTYLVCRLLVFTQSNTHNDSIAHFLTTTHQRSRGEALAMLLFSCSWLYELLHKAMIMFFMTIVGGALATAIYNDALETTVTIHPSDSDLEQTALMKMSEFKDEAGVDPTELFKRIPPKFLAWVAALAWINFGTLSLYVLRLTWKSMRTVLGSSSASVPSVVAQLLN